MKTHLPNTFTSSYQLQFAEFCKLDLEWTEGSLCPLWRINSKITLQQSNFLGKVTWMTGCGSAKWFVNPAGSQHRCSVTSGAEAWSPDPVPSPLCHPLSRQNSVTDFSYLGLAFFSWYSHQSLSNIEKSHGFRSGSHMFQEMIQRVDCAILCRKIHSKYF